MENIFFEGGTFFDRVGCYTVNKIDRMGMQITYENGESEFVDTSRFDIKARIHQNIHGEYTRKHQSTNENYFRTLGFLARHGRFKAELPEHTVKGFVGNYEQLTGEPFPTTHEDIRYEYNPAIWGPGLRIVFQEPDFELDFGMDVDDLIYSSARVITLSRNKLWLKLISLGFRLGTDHKVDQISKSILDKSDRKFFEEGLNYRLTDHVA